MYPLWLLRFGSKRSYCDYSPQCRLILQRSCKIILLVSVHLCRVSKVSKMKSVPACPVFHWEVQVWLMSKCWGQVHLQNQFVFVVSYPPTQLPRSKSKSKVCVCGFKQAATQLVPNASCCHLSRQHCFSLYCGIVHCGIVAVQHCFSLHCFSACSIQVVILHKIRAEGAIWAGNIQVVILPFLLWSTE